MLLESRPLIRAKLHSPPVVVPRIVLWTESDAPRFIRRTFRRRDMGLKLDRVRSCPSDRVDKRMGLAETSIVGLRNLTDDETIPGPLTGFNTAQTNFSEALRHDQITSANPFSTRLK